MKKTIITTLALILLSVFLSPFFIQTAGADFSGKYLRVINDSTPFYKNANETTPLFYLPYTYYVKPLGTVGTLTHVECYGNGGIATIDGYVPTDLLFDDGLSVVNPYVVLELTTANTAVLYKDTSLTEPMQYLFAERQLKYYGNMTVGNERAYYVSYNDKLGYVKESDVYPFLIADHPNELTFLPQETPDQPIIENPSETNDLFALKITIFVCLIFAGIIALIIALKGKPSKKIAVGYYDDNDYE